MLRSELRLTYFVKDSFLGGPSKLKPVVLHVELVSLHVEYLSGCDLSKYFLSEGIGVETAHYHFCGRLIVIYVINHFFDNPHVHEEVCEPLLFVGGA